MKTYIMNQKALEKAFDNFMHAHPNDTLSAEYIRINNEYTSLYWISIYRRHKNRRPVDYNEDQYYKNYMLIFY